MPKASIFDKQGIIYGLKDPFTNEIRYIGMTVLKPSIRFNQHLQEAINNYSKNSEKNAWVKSLLDKGVKPEMVVLAEGLGRDLISSEIHFIEKYGATNPRLLNKAHNRPVTEKWLRNPTNSRNFEARVKTNFLKIISN